MARQTPLESRFQKKVLSYLNELPNTYCFKKEAAAIRGIPDIIACVNGMFVALELKRSNKHKATELQAYTIELINSSKGFATVCNPENFDQVKIVLEGMAFN